ncbi:peptidase S41 [Bacteroidia bacterium]|nr:peptidase S41 [Bacteroidia bacterium]
MRRYTTYLLSLTVAFLTAGCEMADVCDSSPRQNFEAFWKLLDENYCYFDYKQVDWDEVYNQYSPMVNETMNESEFFHILSDMANKLKDGHINVRAKYFFSAYDGWYIGSPSNFNWNIIQDYYQDGQYAGAFDEIRYNQLADNQVGYIYYGSFSESILESELNEIFDSFKDCKGLIIDVRNNGGGSLTNSDRLASRFLDTRTLCGYIQHKTGKGHGDFSTPYPIYLVPSKGDLWLKPVIVLTNRRCFSAANNFVSKMHVLPNVYTLGDTTGGGSGFPFTSELPNGWEVRFSTSPILDINKQHTEFGIAPDIQISLDSKDEEKRKDTLIETAIQHLLGTN